MSAEAEATLVELRVRWTQGHERPLGRYDEIGQNEIVQGDIETLERLVSEISPNVNPSSKGKLEAYMSRILLEADKASKAAAEFSKDVEDVRRGNLSSKYGPTIVDTARFIQRAQQAALKKLVVETIDFVLAEIRQQGKGDARANQDTSIDLEMELRKQKPLTDAEATLEELLIRWTQGRYFPPGEYDAKGQNETVQGDIETLERLVSEISPNVNPSSKGKLKGYISAIRLQDDTTSKAVAKLNADIQEIRQGKGPLHSEDVSYYTTITSSDGLTERVEEMKLRKLVFKTISFLLALVRQQGEEKARPNQDTSSKEDNKERFDRRLEEGMRAKEKASH